MEPLGQIGLVLAMPVSQLGQLASLFILGMGLAWASGISLYVALLMLGIMGISGDLDLPVSLKILENPKIITLAAVMYVIEFIVVRTSNIDMGWDLVHSCIYIAAGASLAAATVYPADPAAPVVTVCVGAIGGWITSVSHASKLETKNKASLQGIYSNWVIAIWWDVVVIGGLWTSFNYPVIFISLLTLGLLGTLIKEKTI